MIFGIFIVLWIWLGLEMAEGHAWAERGFYVCLGAIAGYLVALLFRERP